MKIETIRQTLKDLLEDIESKIGHGQTEAVKDWLMAATLRVWSGNKLCAEEYVKVLPVFYGEHYTTAQVLPLPDMYGKNLTFKTGGVDGCDCAEILALIEAGKIDTAPLITHRFKLEDIEEAYHIFENKLNGVIKIAIAP